MRSNIECVAATAATAGFCPGSQAVWDQDGRALRVVGSHSDISARKQDEENLRASEIRYRTLFQQNPLPTLIYRIQDLQILDVNQAAIDHYGWSREEFLGMTVSSIRAPGEGTDIEAELRQCSASHRPSKPLRRRRKNKRIFGLSFPAMTLRHSAVRPGWLWHRTDRPH